jgi:ABC-type phosphate transport system substrate-binding protein
MMNDRAPTRPFVRRGFAALAALAAVIAATPAGAAPTENCYDMVERPNVIYVSGSSAVRSFLGAVAKLLAADVTPYTVVYQSQGSCVGVEAVFSTDPQKRVIRDVPAANGKPANYAVFFKADGTSEECFLSAGGDEVDVGVSDVYAATCGFTAPADVTIGDYQGPVQPMTFVVPALSTQRSISAEAAYMVFGTGGNKGAAAPWTDPTYYFIRNASSGTQQMLARAIKVPAEKWWGGDRGGSSAVRDGLAILLDPTLAEKAIGILSTDVVDDKRDDLRVLALQAFGQKCGYLPDSTPFLFDKQNVRDGHYPIWGPVHFYARTTAGNPSPEAAALVKRFAAPKLDPVLIETIAAKHLVPKCAMRVDRSEEMGPLKPYMTETRCSCLFDKLTNGKTTCQTCAASAECPMTAPACSYGYCETP